MPQRYSDFVHRLGGRGADAWQIHSLAVAARERGEDVVVLSVGDPEFDTPAAVVDEARAALARGDTHYTPMRGIQPLREVIAERHRRASGQRVDADNVVVVPGAQAGLFCASMCLGNPGDEVITTDPVYTTYEATLGASGARVVRVPLDPRRRFGLDPDRLADAFSDRTRAIFLANPNNPTGTVLDTAAMQAVAELAVRHDVVVVADEVYAEQVYDGAFHPFASLGALDGRLVTVSSLSKSHAMTGWRLGWMVVPSDMAAHLENLLLAMLYGMPGFVQAAALAALQGCDDQVAAMRAAYRNRRTLVAQALRAVPTLRCMIPDAGMFMLVDVSACGIGSDAFARRLYHEHGVSVLDAAAFGDGGRGYVRISFASGEADLAEGCRRMADFANALGEAGRT